MKHVRILAIALLFLLHYNSVFGMDQRKLQLTLSEAPTQPPKQTSFYEAIKTDITALTYCNEEFIRYLSNTFKLHPILMRHNEDSASDKACCLGKEKKLNEASQRVLGMILQIKTMQQEFIFKPNYDQQHSSGDENSTTLDNAQSQSNLQNIEANLATLTDAQRAITARYISVKKMTWAAAENK